MNAAPPAGGTGVPVLGFIGLGVMGSRMCANLIRRSGATVVVYDPVPEALDRAVAQGGQPLLRRCRCRPVRRDRVSLAAGHRPGRGGVCRTAGGAAAAAGRGRHEHERRGADATSRRPPPGRRADAGRRAGRPAPAGGRGRHAAHHGRRGGGGVRRATAVPVLHGKRHRARRRHRQRPGHEDRQQHGALPHHERAGRGAGDRARRRGRGGHAVPDPVRWARPTASRCARRPARR